MQCAHVAAVILLPTVLISASLFPVPPVYADSPATSSAMVIVTVPEQVVQYQRLADYKTAIGLPTTVHTLNAIEAAYPAVDAPASVRAFLQDLYVGGSLEYVLLGGTDSLVPYRRVGNSTSPPFTFGPIPTELYYADLDGSWDGDGDGIYGEPEDDVEGLHDIFVGRLPSADASQAEAILDKVLNYQQSPPSGFAESGLFGANVLFPATWQSPDPIQLDGAVYAEEYLGFAPGSFAMTRIYQNDVAYPGSHPASLTTLTTALQAGPHFVFYQSFGAIDVFLAGTDNVTPADLSTLTNGNRTGIFIARTGACAEPGGLSIAGSWIQAPAGGGVATFGTTVPFYVGQQHGVDLELFRLLFEEGVTEAGRANALSAVALPSGYPGLNGFALNLLADPSMPIWTTEPLPLELDHAGTWIEGNGPYVVTVTAGGVPLEAARVAVCGAGGAYAVGVTDAAGDVALAVEPEAGPYTVGAWKQGHLPRVETGIASATTGAGDRLPRPGLAYPNPFRTRTAIAYATESRGPVRIQVFDLRGRLVRTLLDCDACDHGEAVWDGRDATGTLQAGGVYTYRVETREGIHRGKLLLTR